MADRAERIVAPWLLGLLGVLLALALYAVRPEMDRMAGDLAMQRPSDLSIEYLEAWLRVQPDSPQLLEILAQQYLGLGRWDEAFRAADHLVRLHDPGTFGVGIRLQVRAAEQKAFQHPPEDPQRDVEVASLIRLLDKLVSLDMDVTTMEDLADTARAVGAAEVSIQLFGRLAVDDPAQAAHWYASLGGVALAHEQYGLASRAYFKAQDHAHTLDLQRKNFLAAVGALQAGDQVALACEQAEQHVGKLVDDLETLRFLISLAQQAGRTDLMQRYGRALAQRIALVPRYQDGLRGALQTGWMARGGIRPVASISGGSAAQARSQSDYELLYQAFIQSGALQDAQDIAQRALAKPYLDRRVWLDRLAQVAEWNGQPRVSMKAWLALAREFDDADAWDHLMRMAPQLDEDEIYLQALLHASIGRPDDLRLITEVVGAHERLGTPEAGLAYLQALRPGRHQRQVQELLAGLAERSGHDDLALSTWQALQARHGPDPVYAMHIARQFYIHLQPRKAFAALKSARKAALGREAPADFWHEYIAFARLLQQPEDLNTAIQGLLAQGVWDDSQYGTLLYAYLGRPIDSARVAEAAFRRTGALTYLQRAVTDYVHAGAIGRARQLFESLSVDQERAVQQSPTLLQTRAVYWLARGNPRASLRDLQRAYALPQGPSQVGVTYLWTLLSYGDRTRTEKVMEHLEARYGTQPQYAEVLGAAHLQLGQPQKALDYMNRQGTAVREDPLWLMSYADACEALGRADQAWRIRRQGWRLLIQRGRQVADVQAARAARISLGQVFLGGDQSLASLLRLLRRGPPDTYRKALAQSVLGDVTGLPTLAEVTMASAAVATGEADGGRRMDAALYAVVLGWAMGGEHHDLARAWLAGRAIADMLKPDSARLAIALFEGDRVMMDRLLRRDSPTLSNDARVQALDQLGRLPQAQSLAMASLAATPDNSPVYEAWRELAQRDRPSAGLRVEYATAQPLQSRIVSMDLGWALSGGLGLKLHHVERLDRTTDTSSLAWVPGRDHTTSLALMRHGDRHRIQLELGWRQGLSSFATGLLSTEWATPGGLGLTLQMGKNRPADVSAMMMVGGSKDFARAELSYSGSGGWLAGGSVEYARFQAQDGQRLGHGLGYAGSVGYRLLQDSPGLTLRAQASQWRYSAESGLVPQFARLMPDGLPPDATSLMPQDTRQYGLALALGTDTGDDYQRGWSPFLELSWMHDSTQGWGLGVQAGVGGSLLGRDRLGVYLAHEAARQGDGQPSTRVGLSYRLYY